MSIIDDLELSVRASNVLRRRGRVETLDDFMALTKDDVMAQPNAGIRTWREIEQMQKWLGCPTPPPTNTALRDAAALAALQGLLSYGAVERSLDKSHEHWHETAAREAFEIADAFIAARETKEDDR